MGSIIWLRRSLWDSIEEQICGRSGLAVSREQVLDFANDEVYRELLDGDDDEIIRIRAEHYACAVCYTLHGIGATNEPGRSSIGTLLIREFRNHCRQHDMMGQSDPGRESIGEGQKVKK